MNSQELLAWQAFFPFAQRFLGQKFLFVYSKDFGIITGSINVGDLANLQKRRAFTEFEKYPVVKFKRATLLLITSGTLF